MTTINDAFINALLADASYVGGLTSSSDLNADLGPRMTPTLATYIGQNFTVVTQIESAGSSFDATVWREIATGKLYVSMRGTQQLTDFLVDADLAVTGNARAQVTDMINWWLRISTPVGQQAKQIMPLGDLYVLASSVPGEGLISSADLAAGIEVNGHSLGGDDALLGRDTFNGGTGDDLIYGSTDGLLTYSVDANWSPFPSPNPIVLGQDYNWVWSATGSDADSILKRTLTTTIVRDTQANDQGNLIDGGAGQNLIASMANCCRSTGRKTQCVLQIFLDLCKRNNFIWCGSHAGGIAWLA